MEATDKVKKSRFAKRLISKLDISGEQVEKAAAIVSSGSVNTLEQGLLETGALTETLWLEEFSGYYGAPIVDFDQLGPDRDLTKLVSPRFANEFTVMPVRLEDDILYVAVSLPLKSSLLQDLAAITGKEVKPLLARRSDIINAIRDTYGVGAETAELMVREGGSQLEVVRPNETESSQELVDAAPVVRFVDQVILEAFSDRATDIHIEPYDRDMRIRYRIDGTLFEVSTPPGLRQFHSAIVSRIKIMASMDIAEKRLPQDGRIKIRAGGEELDLRVATLPSSHGESISIRILRRMMLFRDIGELGLEKDTLDRVKRIIRGPHGIILVTGPTGSGKTTSLYAFLGQLNSREKKIITLEDPVEYEIEGITQIQVRPKIDLGFANGLRSILRHDPDVIMVGEMRDYETAAMGVQSALTGHMVFSTLHTNDAPGAVIRLQDMGIPLYLIASSLRAVIAQRLVRVLCPECKQQYRPDPAILLPFGISAARAARVELWRSGGCERCRNTGFRGRTGIYEIMTTDEALKGAILQGASADELRNIAERSGMQSLYRDGWLKLKKGITTPEEVLNVTEGELPS